RLYEIMNEKGMGYQLVSNIIHRRPVPQIKKTQAPYDWQNMTQAQIDEGIAAIALELEGFNYEQAIALILDDDKLLDLYVKTDRNYKKLHLYRILFERRPNEEVESSAIKKFIDQAFHIETDYIYQLNPAKYQTVPQYVIDECDRLIETLISVKSAEEAISSEDRERVNLSPEDQAEILSDRNATGSV
ncbi:MAG: hypothetical protein ACFB16_00290, partial [Phormidesmis sp.]